MIIRTTESEAILEVENIWSQYVDGLNVLVEVREISSNVENMQQLSPISKVIFQDGSFDESKFLLFVTQE